MLCSASVYVQQSCWAAPFFFLSFSPSLTRIPTSVDFPALLPLPGNAWGNDIYSSYGFEAAGLDVRALANSALVEFCNNANNWEIVMGLVDAQQVRRGRAGGR